VRRLFSALLAGALLLFLGSSAANASVAPRKGQVIVSLTFDGGYKGQDIAGTILASHQIAGTFYVNSGYIGFPAYMSLDQLRGLSRQGHEIGGASTQNNDLSKLPIAEAAKQVCDDRATLDRLGFRVTSFAYPRGADTVGVRRAVSQCGYNSARDVSGLHNSATDCGDCPVAETIPPTNDFRIRTSENATTLEVLKARVTSAESGGGGWVPLGFRFVCVCPSKGAEAITPSELTAFVSWLSDRPPGTTDVRTVDRVVGGGYKIVKGQADARLVPPDGSSPGQPARPLSSAPAWSFWGLEIGQSQLIATGLLLTLTVVLTYRAAARRNRYERTARQP
jgi:peptidoglycan/xylan/chitin deacetylase (PgdA/CDA1 family)